MSRHGHDRALALNLLGASVPVPVVARDGGVTCPSCGRLFTNEKLAERADPSWWIRWSGHRASRVRICSCGSWLDFSLCYSDAMAVEWEAAGPAQRERLDRVFELVETLCVHSEFHAVDEMMESFIFDGAPAADMVAWLTVTLPWRLDLKKREAFVQNVRRQLVAVHGSARTSSIMVGLE